jgi:hypothetical protein
MTRTAERRKLTVGVGRTEKLIFAQTTNEPLLAALRSNGSELTCQLWNLNSPDKARDIVVGTFSPVLLKGPRPILAISPSADRLAVANIGERNSRLYLFDVEAYHKGLEGVTEFSQRFRRSPEERPEELFFVGTGVAKGIEFLAQKKSGRLNGWASYTLGKVEYQIPPFNGGAPYPADQDRRHEIKLVGNYGLGKWNFAATWVYASGAPYICGAFIIVLQLMAGAAGHILDIFFQRSHLDRKTIVGTKAVTQVAGHLYRIAYFGSFEFAFDTAIPWWGYAGAIVLSFAGTSLAAPVLLRMTDVGFRAWSRRVTIAVAVVYLVRGLWLVALP